MSKAELVFNEEFTSRNFNTSPLTISNLEGDTYDYELIIHMGSTDNTTNWRYRFNADSGSNYRNYYLLGNGSSPSAQVADSETSISESQTIRTGSLPTFVKMKITGSSGDERYIDMFMSVREKIYKKSAYWKDTASELASIVIDTAGSATLSDTHIFLYRTPKNSGQSSWELMKVVDFTSRDLAAGASPIDFTVDGDQDIQYKIQGSITYTTGASLGMVFNSDTSSNYTLQYMYNDNGTDRATNRTDTSIETEAAGSTDNEEFTFIINAESGVDRLVRMSQAQTDTSDQNELSAWWGNTANNLTAIRLRTAASESATGTVKLYRKRNPLGTGDTLPFEVIGAVDISGDFSAGHTFSNLTGDSTKLYKLEFIGETDSQLRLQFNGDTGTNHDSELLLSNSSSMSAANNTSVAYQEIHSDSNNETAETEVYIYPKSGDNRAMLVRDSYRASRLRLQGGWWNNSVDEITSMKVFANNTNTMTGRLILSRLV